MAGPGPQPGVSNLKQKTKHNQKQTKQTQGKPTNIVWEPSWPGLAPRLGCARLSGVPKTKKQKENKNKNNKHKENQQNKVWEPSWPGGAPRLGCARRRIDYSNRTPSKTKEPKTNKQNHKNTGKTNKPKFGNHPGRAGPGQPPGPTRMVPKL